MKWAAQIAQPTSQQNPAHKMRSQQFCRTAVMSAAQNAGGDFAAKLEKALANYLEKYDGPPRARQFFEGPAPDFPLKFAGCKKIVLVF